MGSTSQRAGEGKVGGRGTYNGAFMLLMIMFDVTPSLRAMGM